MTATTAGMNSSHSDFYVQLRARITRYLDTQAGRAHPWASVLLLAPDLFHLLTRLMADDRVPLKQKALLGGALAYFVSPIELLPEAILGPIGFLDDIALAAYALNSVFSEIDPQIARDHWAGEGDVLEVVRGVTEKANRMLGGRVWGKLLRRFRK